MSKLQQLADSGQSVWYDYIQRSLLSSERFNSLIEHGLRGVTSNPTIFMKAISGSSDYDDAMYQLDESAENYERYEALVLEDIANAADLFRPVFEATNGLDGYVSIEVSPKLAYDSKGTVEEAIRLFNQLKRPNIMIKVPATEEGIPAVSELIGLGINVNVTLIFGIEQYLKVANAYIEGLETFQARKGDLRKVASVASFFVSRVDTLVDQHLAEKGNTELQGKIAIANSKVAYHEAKRLYTEPRWKKLETNGARVQRLLWASTGTKNPAYSDTLYVDELIGRNTVNTMPPATLDAFLDHGTVQVTLDRDVDEARQQLAQLKYLGLDLQQITQTLEADGVRQFEESFEALLGAIDQKQVVVK